ncbi:MAG: TnsA endonuclease N-terminal domain-containing protein [Neptuniibacter sp.]
MGSKTAFLTPYPKEINNLLEPAILKRLQREKRGQGFGKDYKPYLTVRDVPSKGRVHRRPALTHNRIVHLLSDLELAAFLLFDWSPSVTDIREQFPLNPEATIDIAKRLSIKHPAYQGVLQVMTTDLLVDLNVNGKFTSQAVSVKYSEHLEDERTLEKQELERRFWEGEGVSWYIFTEQDVPVTSVKNIRWLAPHMHSYDLKDEERAEVFERIAKVLDGNWEEKVAVPLIELDNTFKKTPGTHLQYFRHFSAQNAFLWDIHNQVHTSLKAKDIAVSEYWLSKEAKYVHA